MVPDGARRQFDAVADDVVLIGVDGERILGEERFHATLRHRERVVAELDLVGVFVELVHREIDDPAELELLRIDEAEFFAQTRAHGAGELGGGKLLVAGEEHGIAVFQAGLLPSAGRRRASSRFLAIGPLATGRFEDDIAEAGGTIALAPNR